MNHFKTIALASIAAMTLFSCQKEINNTPSKENKPSEDLTKKTANIAWGLGTDNRVYTWNSLNNSWYEPNPTARLTRISVGQDNTGAVWGIDSEGRIYQRTGSVWNEPNISARLSNISAYSATIAYGVSSDEKILFKTTDGGLNWTTVPLTGVPYPGILTIKSVSTMTGADAMIVMSSGAPYKYTASGWQYFGIVGSSLDLTMASGSSTGCWAVKNQAYGNVLYHNGTYWDTPNPAASLATISMSDENVVWGTSSTNHVYRWNALTNSWDEPNPAAGLKTVSSGN